MIPARSSACSSHWRRRSSRSTEPVVGRLHHDHPHAGHHRGRRVGAVRGRRDQDDVAVGVAVGAVVAADGQQPGELALRAGVGLDRDLVVAGDLGQPALEVGDQPAVARRVLGRRERVQVGEAGQADRLHLGRGVELHRARAERDHAAVERVVAGGEPAQVAQQLGLAAVLVEDRVGEVVGRAAQVAGQRVGRVVVRRGRGARPRRPRRRAAPSATVDQVVVSDVESATVSASTSRSWTPWARAAATISAARPGAGTVRVSKKCSCATS